MTLRPQSEVTALRLREASVLVQFRFCVRGFHRRQTSSSVSTPQQASKRSGMFVTASLSTLRGCDRFVARRHVLNFGYMLSLCDCGRLRRVSVAGCWKRNSRRAASRKKTTHKDHVQFSLGFFLTYCSPPLPPCVFVSKICLFPAPSLLKTTKETTPQGLFTSGYMFHNTHTDAK